MHKYLIENFFFLVHDKFGAYFASTVEKRSAVTYLSGPSYDFHYVDKKKKQQIS